MSEYKWSNPLDWLADRIANAEESELRGILHAVIDKLDADEVQDIFQAEMDEDGYFHPLRTTRDAV